MAYGRDYDDVSPISGVLLGVAMPPLCGRDMVARNLTG